MKVKTLERCFNERIEWGKGNIVDTVEDRIQNASLTAIGSINTPEIELAFKSKNASSGQDATSVTANSERGEHVGITAPFDNVSKRNNTLHVFNTNDETRSKVSEEVKELSVPEAFFDWQPHTHHNNRVFFWILYDKEMAI